MLATVLLAAAMVLMPPVLYLGYLLFIQPRFNPLQNIPGPPSQGLFADQCSLVTHPALSFRTHDKFVKEIGRNVRIRGPLPWDLRLVTLDPVTVTHVMKNTDIYEKPWQTRRLVTGIIGWGMLSTEGQVHRRQRRVANPAFSMQNMRALVPIVFAKGVELKNKWHSIIADANAKAGAEKVVRIGAKIDTVHWINRSTFDVIGSAGFDYEFDAVEKETNELFIAFREMFEVAIAARPGLRTLTAIYFPIIDTLFPDKAALTVRRCQKVVKRVAGQIVQEKKRKMAEALTEGRTYEGKDLLSLLLKSNASEDLPPDQRISDEDILHTINTFMFAGSDTTSLSITWTLYLLARYPEIQSRLRKELLAIMPLTSLDTLTQEEITSLYNSISELPFLENVIRESLRLIPPVHSTIRMATQDDVLPTSVPVPTRMPDGTIKEEMSILLPKGACVHIPIEGFNLDKEIWGPDAWTFNPDRWDDLPEPVMKQPGVYNNILSFSAGPRACIGLRFGIIELKTFIFLLVSSFELAESDEKVGKANVALTRPYVASKYLEGSQCPLMITPYGAIPTS